MGIDRRTFVKGTGIAGVTGVAGCTGGPDDGGEGDDGTPADGDGADGADGTPEDGGAGGSADVHVGMVYATGGLGDGSFNDQAQSGIQQAADEFDVAYDQAQPDEVAQFGDFQQQFASSQDPDYDLVTCIGFLQADALSETAPQFSEQDFMIVDSVVEEDNVASYVFKEEEGSFLCGQLAGLLTREEFSAGGGETSSEESKVGFVGGVEGDLIKKFEAGYVAGVEDVSEDIDVQSTYVGDFNDPSGGQEAALAMYEDGADVVYHAAGNTGTGVFEAAQGAERYAIGVDRDQSKTKESYADVILGSMVKRVDTAVYDSVEATVDGEFETGSTVTLGLEEEGVSLVYGQQLGGEISSDVKSEVEASKEAIVGGEISVPTDPTDI